MSAMCIEIKRISVISSQLKLTKHLCQWLANFVSVISVFVKTKFHPPLTTKKLTYNNMHISRNIEFASVSSIRLEFEIGQKPLISKNKFLAR